MFTYDLQPSVLHHGIIALGRRLTISRIDTHAADHLQALTGQDQRSRPSARHRSGCALANMSKITPYFIRQNSRISFAEPVASPAPKAQNKSVEERVLGQGGTIVGLRNEEVGLGGNQD